MFVCKHQILLVRRDALLVLEFGFGTVSGITGLNLESDGLAHVGTNTYISATATQLPLEAKETYGTGNCRFVTKQACKRCTCSFTDYFKVFCLVCISLGLFQE